MVADTAQTKFILSSSSRDGRLGDGGGGLGDDGGGLGGIGHADDEGDMDRLKASRERKYLCGLLDGVRMCGRGGEGGANR